MEVESPSIPKLNESILASPASPGKRLPQTPEKMPSKENSPNPSEHSSKMAKAQLITIDQDADRPYFRAKTLRPVANASVTTLQPET